MKVLYRDLWPLRRKGRQMTERERAYRAKVRANKRAAKEASRSVPLAKCNNRV